MLSHIFCCCYFHSSTDKQDPFFIYNIYRILFFKENIHGEILKNQFKFILFYHDKKHLLMWRQTQNIKFTMSRFLSFCCLGCSIQQTFLMNMNRNRLP